MLRSKYNEGHGRRAKPRPCEEEDFDDDDEMWTKPFRKKQKKEKIVPRSLKSNNHSFSDVLI